MKINSLLETETASSSPLNTSPSAPKFGRSDKFLETEETVEECTTSGSVASVASPVGGMQRRGKGSIFSGIKTSDKFANSKAVKENSDEEVTDEGFFGFGSSTKPQQQPRKPLDYSAVRQMSQGSKIAKQYHPDEYMKKFGAFAEDELDENSMADFFTKAAQEKFPTATIRKDGETIQQAPAKPQPQQQPVDIEQLEQQLAGLEQKYEQLGGDSWQYADKMMPRDIEAAKIYTAMVNLGTRIANAKKSVEESNLNEFAPGGDDSNDGFSEETLKMLAAQWYNGDEDPRVERTLMAAGWEIGQDEGYDDEPGVFVVQSGDTHGDSYLSWSAHDLKQGVAENQVNEKSLSKAQFRTMAAVAHNPEFAKKVGISQKVGKEFHKADKGVNYKSLPKKVDEAEISEDMLAHELFKDLQIFKKGADKDIGAKAKDKDISSKAKDKDIVTKEDKDPCWKGYKQIGMKDKAGKKVPNCVPVKEEFDGEYDDEAGSTESNLLTTARAVKGLLDTIKDRDNLPEWVQEKIAKAEGMLVASWDYLQSQKEQGIDPQVDEDWQKTNRKDKTDGMSSKAVKAYRRENPGSKLQTAVTKKPSELKAGSKDAKRRKSFCARMSGVEGPMKDEKGRPTPKAKALKRWNC